MNFQFKNFTCWKLTLKTVGHRDGLILFSFIIAEHFLFYVPTYSSERPLNNGKHFFEH